MSVQKPIIRIPRSIQYLALSTEPVWIPGITLFFSATLMTWVIASSTAGSPVFPGMPREAAKSDGPTKAASMPGTIQTALLSDPSDYSVATDGTIEVQPLETLGHYGDWLEIKTQRLRDLNGLAFKTPVAVGDRIRLDLGTVDATLFEQRRVTYQRQQQDSFFRRHVITGVAEHTIKAGESIWIIALRQYEVPLWLFRQYNPSLDLHKVRPGVNIQIPILADAGTD